MALGVEKEEIDEDRLIMALNQARIDDLLELLPKGAETLLGEHGVRLSVVKDNALLLLEPFTMVVIFLFWMRRLVRLIIRQKRKLLMKLNT